MTGGDYKRETIIKRKRDQKEIMKGMEGEEEGEGMKE